MGSLRSIVLLCIAFAYVAFFSFASADTPYKELYFDQAIDHFNVYWKSYGKQTFMQRYLVQGEQQLWTE